MHPKKNIYIAKYVYTFGPFICTQIYIFVFHIEIKGLKKEEG